LHFARIPTSPFYPMRLFIADCIDFPLRSRGRSRLFLALVTVVVLTWSAEAIKIAKVTALGSSTEISEVRKGLALDPGNPELHYRLSQLYSDSLGSSNLTWGVAQARSAIALNPNKFNYWLNLASACESIRDNACVEQALERTLELCPMVPMAWWAAGNQYLRINQPEKASRCFQRLLKLSPEYLTRTLDLTLRAYGDPHMIFERVVGGGTDAPLAIAFADYMSVNNEFDAAQQAWRRLAGRGATFPFVAVQPYLEQLLRHGQYQNAQTVWLYLERRGIIATPADNEHGNLVFNGGFEESPLGAGFDWRSQPLSYVSVDFDDHSAYDGARCLRVDFLVSQNDEFEPVYQILPVVPGLTYTLAAYVRTTTITSDSGPRLRIVEPGCSACQTVSTESTTGTTAWHSVSVSFTTGRQTQVVRISVWRPRNRTFPMDISGSFWLDDVSMRPANPAEERTVANR